jgi:hypothetical protein
MFVSRKKSRRQLVKDRIFGKNIKGSNKQSSANAENDDDDGEQQQQDLPKVTTLSTTPSLDNEMGNEEVSPEGETEGENFQNQHGGDAPRATRVSVSVSPSPSPSTLPMPEMLEKAKVTHSRHKKWLKEQQEVKLQNSIFTRKGDTIDFIFGQVESLVCNEDNDDDDENMVRRVQYMRSALDPPTVEGEQDGDYESKINDFSPDDDDMAPALERQSSLVESISNSLAENIVKVAEEVALTKRSLMTAAMAERDFCLNKRPPPPPPPAPLLMEVNTNLDEAIISPTTTSMSSTSPMTVLLDEEEKKMDDRDTMTMMSVSPLQRIACGLEPSIGATTPKTESTAKSNISAKKKYPWSSISPPPPPPSQNDTDHGNEMNSLVESVRPDEEDDTSPLKLHKLATMQDDEKMDYVFENVETYVCREDKNGRRGTVKITKTKAPLHALSTMEEEKKKAEQTAKAFIRRDNSLLDASSDSECGEGDDDFNDEQEESGRDTGADYTNYMDAEMGLAVTHSRLEQIRKKKRMIENQVCSSNKDPETGQASILVPRGYKEPPPPGTAKRQVAKRAIEARRPLDPSATPRAGPNKSTRSNSPITVGSGDFCTSDKNSGTTAEFIATKAPLCSKQQLHRAVLAIVMTLVAAAFAIVAVSFFWPKADKPLQAPP